MEEDSARSVTRARFYESKLREERVEECAALMRDLTYRTGKTTKELAAKWGCSLDVAQQVSAEASRRVRSQLDKDRAGALISARMEQVLCEGEDRDAIGAGKLLVDALGLAPPPPIDPMVLVQSMPPAERSAWLQRQAEGIRRALSTILPAPAYLAWLDGEVEARAREAQELRGTMATQAEGEGA